MGKLTLFIATTLDGYIAGPNDEIDWLFEDGDYGYQSFFDACSWVVVGRRTFEISQKLAAEPFPDKDVLVVSSSKNGEIEGRTRYVGSDWVEQVSDLKTTATRNIWLVGGGSLIAESINMKILDDIIISIHPVLLGNGKSLVSNALKYSDLKLINSETYESGLIQLHYQVLYDHYSG